MIKTVPLMTLILIFCLTSCGFHLQGPVPLAPSLHTLYLETKDPYGLVTKNLTQYLKISGVHLVNSPELADTILVILQESTSQQLLGISGSQQTRQYNLLLNIVFQVTDKNGKVIVPPQSVLETRSFTIKSDQILAGSNEANYLYTQMRQTIVSDIMNRLSSKEITTMLTSVDHTS